MPMPQARRPTLRSVLSSGQFVLAPGIFDMVTARVADSMGFPALYMTGYGAAASHLGLPDAGLATYTDMVGRAKVIAGRPPRPSSGRVRDASCPAPGDGVDHVCACPWVDTP